MRFFLAIQCFFRVLFNASYAKQLRLISADKPADKPTPKPAAEPVAVAPKRSDAVALLSVLQREARFVDLVLEPLENYNDAQIGAAAREVLGDCGKVLDRLFALHPAVEGAEGEPLEVPAEYDTGRFRLTGNVAKPLPASGTLLHAGWEAKQCDLPAWTGKPSSALVVAPAEVEIK